MTQRIAETTDVEALLEPMRSRLRIRGDPRECERLTEEVIANAVKYEYDASQRFAIAIALNEALTNAVRHGNAGDRSKSILLEYTMDFDTVRIAVTDQGVGFDTDAALFPNAERNQENPRSRGLQLMVRFMSGISYTPPGNRVEVWLHQEDDAPLKNPPKKRTTSLPSHILLAEDDAEMRNLLDMTFRGAGYEVTACADGWELLRQLGAYFLFAEQGEKVQFDLIVSDIRMPGLSGLEVLEAGQSIASFPPMILITAFGDDRTHAAAKSASAAQLFDKPFDINTLLTKAVELVPPLAK